MIIFLYGEDAFRSRQKLKEIKNKFLEEDKSGMGLFCFEGKVLDLDELKKSIGMVSLFDKKKLIILEDLLSKGKKEAQDLLGAMIKEKKIGEEIILLVLERNKFDKRRGLFKLLQKVDIVEEYNFLNNYELSQWVGNEIKERGGLIDKMALQKLVNFVGSDLWRMDKEIDKLIAFTMVGEGGRKQISNEDVKLLVVARIDDNIFNFTDALGRGDKKNALKLLHEQLELGQSVYYLLSMMNFQFRNLIRVKSLAGQNLNQYQIAKKAKMHPYVVKKSLEVLGGFDLEKLKKIYNGLVELEHGLKRGEVEPVLALDRFVVNL